MKAQWICFHCEVQLECKGYRSRTNSKDGIWGGKLANELIEEEKEKK